MRILVFFVLYRVTTVHNTSPTQHSTITSVSYHGLVLSVCARLLRSGENQSSSKSRSTCINCRVYGSCSCGRRKSTAAAAVATAAAAAAAAAVVVILMVLVTVVVRSSGCRINGVSNSSSSSGCHIIGVSNSSNSSGCRINGVSNSSGM